MTDNHKKLKELVYQGLAHKNLIVSDLVLDRISYELSVIEKLGCTDYFILYSRIIEVCNEFAILRTYGRAAAANSLVNYCLDITKINPIDENLVFERFLNPHDNTPPNIDIDVPKGYQKQVVDKLIEKYPEYNAYYIAFSQLADAKYEDVLYNNNSYKKHPTGIIITPEKISQPVFSYNHEEYYLAVDLFKDTYVEQKIDIVELEYLNRLQCIINEIGEEYQPDRLPLDDKEVFDFFTKGDLNNIINFNFKGAREVFSDFLPTSIQDLCIISAMSRPNLIDFIPYVTKRKFNPITRFILSDPRVNDILKDTYALLIYQETFLHLAKEIAGISYADAETWRDKIMWDKSDTALKAFIPIFTQGCRLHSSLAEDEIPSLIKMISIMLPNTFQKSHALSYAILGYWGAYYKTHFRAEFDKAFRR